MNLVDLLLGIQELLGKRIAEHTFAVEVKFIHFLLGKRDPLVLLVVEILLLLKQRLVIFLGVGVLHEGVHFLADGMELGLFEKAFAKFPCFAQNQIVLFKRGHNERHNFQNFLRSPASVKERTRAAGPLGSTLKPWPAPALLLSMGAGLCQSASQVRMTLKRPAAFELAPSQLGEAGGWLGDGLLAALERTAHALGGLSAADSVGVYLAGENSPPRRVGSCGSASFPDELPQAWMEGPHQDPLGEGIRLASLPPHSAPGLPEAAQNSSSLLRGEGNQPRGPSFWIWVLAGTSPAAVAPNIQRAMGALVDNLADHAQALASAESDAARARRHELAAGHAGNLYAALVESLPQSIFRKDLDGRFTFANSRMLESMGLPAEQVVGKTDQELFPEEIALKYQADDRMVLENRVPLDQVEKHLDSNGLVKHVRVIKAPILDSAGTACGIQGIYWDETERHLMEQRLHREHLLLRAMMDHVPDSVYFKDLDSRFIMLSHSLATKMGLADPAEAIGKNDHDFFDPRHADESLADERRIIATGKPVKGRTEREIWLDGRERWVLTTKLPLRGEDGRIHGTLGVSKDITDIKQVEVELEHARDQALASVRLKSEFLANMSHEIRTPLNAVVGMAGLLLDTELSEDQQDFADTIRKSADSLLAIINDILDFSKIEAGKLSIEHIVFDLHEAVENTVELLGEAARKKGIELLCWIRESVPRMVNGDPGRIRQVLVNLVGNAVKFTSEGEVVIDVSATPAKKSQMEVRFEVRDTGIGIPDEARARLFQPFSQADGSTTRKFGGTGLGLAISRQLVELMGGEIGVQSVAGEGSTFWLQIRLDNLDSKVPPPVPPAADTLRGKSVLIVDDNETNRLILQHQTRGWGMETHEASTAEGALHSLRVLNSQGRGIHVVILDLQMPTMDGFQLADAIAKLGLSRQPTLLLLTSSCLFNMSQASAHGIHAVMNKPVKRMKLFETLAATLAANEPNAPEGRASQAAWRGPAQPPLPQRRSSVRILVAEDNAVNQKVALMQLSRLGYSADAVASGAEAVEAVAKMPYDIILMDCQMPELDGLDATRHIRAMESRHRDPRHPRGIYIIALTANAFAEDRDKCLAAGMNDYLSKPVQLGGLQEALARGVDFLGELPHRVSSGDTGYFSLSTPVLNATALRTQKARPEGLGGGTALEARIDRFMDEATVAIAEMKQRQVSADLCGLKETAIRLRDSAADLECARLARTSDEIVELARKGLPPPEELLSQLQREFDRVGPLLARFKVEETTTTTAQ